MRHVNNRAADVSAQRTATVAAVQRPEWPVHTYTGVLQSFLTTLTRDRHAAQDEYRETRF